MALPVFKIGRLPLTAGGLGSTPRRFRHRSNGSNRSFRLIRRFQSATYKMCRVGFAAAHDLETRVGRQPAPPSPSLEPAVPGQMPTTVFAVDVITTRVILAVTTVVVPTSIIIVMPIG